jgi:hypothetical protein
MSQSERQIQARTAENRVQELRAAAHLMTLDTGTFCLVNGSAKAADDLFSGVRVSVRTAGSPAAATPPSSACWPARPRFS